MIPLSLYSNTTLIDVPLAIVGPKDCSNVEHIWPEFREKFQKVDVEEDAK